VVLCLPDVAFAKAGVLRGELIFLLGEYGLYHNRGRRREKNSDIQLDPEKLKQADFVCFNGLCMLLWDRS